MRERLAQWLIRASEGVYILSVVMQACADALDDQALDVAELREELDDPALMAAYLRHFRE